jgi:transcriptional regulator with XRE-family HTH domain
MDAITLGKRLRWARKRAGLTQQQLADAAGVPQPSIARIERGTVMPRAAMLIDLLAATGHRLAVEPIEPAADQDAIRKRLGMSVPQRTRASMRATKGPTAPVVPLRRLRRFNVPFVLIGELAEVAHGSPVRVRGPIEVCHATTQVAEERLDLARADLGRQADPSRLRIVTQTDAGDTYDVLVRNAVNLPVDAGLLVRVAAVDDLIRARRARHTLEDDKAASVLMAIRDA